MQQDRIRWNQKYTDETHPINPSRIVQDFYNMAPKGRVLDIAAGNGRNALFLAENGFYVDAVDISDVGLNRVSKRHINLNLICADFDNFNIPKNRYSLIVNCRFLERRLFPFMQEGLVSGGLLIFETYLEPLGKKIEEPSRRKHLLKKNELLRVFLPLQILFYRETRESDEKGSEYIASLVGMKNG